MGRVMEYTFQELSEKGLLREISGFILENNSIDAREIYSPLPICDYYVENGKQYPVRAAYVKNFKFWGEKFEYNPKTGKYILAIR